MSNNESTQGSVVRITIVGVGGGGKNAVERMLETNIPCHKEMRGD